MSCIILIDYAILTYVEKYNMYIYNFSTIKQLYTFINK